MKTSTLIYFFPLASNSYTNMIKGVHIFPVHKNELASIDASDPYVFKFLKQDHIRESSEQGIRGFDSKPSFI